MGTNFYWRTPRYSDILLPTGEMIEAPTVDRMDPRIHIGKRSAAGWYCYDCRRTLCAGGEAEVHSGRSNMLAACPSCGKKTVDAVAAGAAGSLAVALGLADPPTERTKGLAGCCSFTWAQDPVSVRAICAVRLDDALIEDEYDKIMTCRAFLEMLESCCPIVFTDAVGTEFS